VEKTFILIVYGLVENKINQLILYHNVPHAFLLTVYHIKKSKKFYLQVICQHQSQIKLNTY